MSEPSSEVTSPCVCGHAQVDHQYEDEMGRGYSDGACIKGTCSSTRRCGAYLPPFPLVEPELRQSLKALYALPVQDSLPSAVLTWASQVTKQLERLEAAEPVPSPVEGPTVSTED